MLNLDLNSEFGARVARRLQQEEVIWLVTVRNDLTPQPVPVWFIWDGETFLIYSQRDKQKLRNIARNPRVSLHFDSNGRGGDIVVISGEAQIDESILPADQVQAYVDKYGAAIAGIGMKPETFARSYSVPIRITALEVRGH